MKRRGCTGQRGLMASVVRGWVLSAGLLLLASGCTGGQGESASVGTSVKRSEPVAAEAVSVVIRLPQGEHTKPVDGWVVDAAGHEVAEFRFEAAVLYERTGEGSGAEDYEARVTQAPTQISLELPGPGTYEFFVGPVEYFGGCGTCGRFHEDGGSVEAEVVDGSVVRLDVGLATAVS